MKQQKMLDHRLIQGMSMAKSTINMKRPIDFLANLSLFGDKGSLPNEVAIIRLYPDTTNHHEYNETTP
jgi:hypothetical protein